MPKQISELTLTPDPTQEAVETYTTDFLRTQMHKLLELKVAAPTDEVLIKELAERMTRLHYLEDQLEEIANLLNCSKKNILAEVVSSEEMLKRAEKAEQQLDSEREKFRRRLLDFENEVRRNAQGLETLSSSYEKLIGEFDALKDENKRLGLWEKLFGRDEGEG